MLHEARRLGFLGPGPVEAHVDHACGFAEVLQEAAANGGGHQAVDLGSGGGVPGLPLALHFPTWRWTLVESSGRRAAFLRQSIVLLELDSRVVVLEQRAELVGRSDSHRGQYDVVVARGFGPPAVVAECGAPLLRVGGGLAVSEPPGGAPDRWPVAGLALLGLHPDGSRLAGGSAYQLLRQVEPCPLRYPRRVGVPGKRPVFD